MKRLRLVVLTVVYVQLLSSCYMTSKKVSDSLHGGGNGSGLMTAVAVDAITAPVQIPVYVAERTAEDLREAKKSKDAAKSAGEHTPKSLNPSTIENRTRRP